APPYLGGQPKVDTEGRVAAGALPRDLPDSPRNNVPSVRSLRLLDQALPPYLNETRCSFSFLSQNAQLALRGCAFYRKRQRSVWDCLVDGLLCLVFTRNEAVPSDFGL